MATKVTQVGEGSESSASTQAQLRAAGEGRVRRNRTGQFVDNDEIDEYFGRQHNSSSDLADPEPILRLLAQGVVEVMAGMRDPAQLANWLADEVYLKVRERALGAQQARASRGEPVGRSYFEVASVRSQSPRDGVIESVVLLKGPTRVRAVTLRLEGYNNRWRATSLAVL